MMAKASFHPLEEHPTSHAAAIHYRERAKTWRESAAAVPDGAPQQAIYREIAEGYEKLAAHYERGEQLERSLKVPVREGVV
jgi:hypothetical protein